VLAAQCVTMYNKSEMSIEDDDNVVITIRCKGWFKKKVLEYCQKPDVDRSMSWMCKKAVSKMLGFDHLISNSVEDDDK